MTMSASIVSLPFWTAPLPRRAPLTAGDQCDPSFLQVGCTAVLAVMKGRELFVANAGDSRAVLGRAGTAVALSEDHKPASTAEKQRITDAGGFVSEVGSFWLRTVSRFHQAAPMSSG
jgi:serine/threonine protein phosphatase PrpC